MDEQRDHDLLAAFIDRRDEKAFALIVSRYVDVVYAAARRQVRSEHLAQDVTQAVFILLARKADSIRGGKVLAGWLVNSACLCARAAVRREARLVAREQKAAMMRSETVRSSDPLDAQDIRPLLDAALAKLNDHDRAAVVLRYLQGKAMKEVAAAMGISESAAAKRVARGTARLRRFLTRRGLELAPMAIAHVLGREMTVTAPPQVAPAAVDAGVSVANGTTPGTPAALIAQDVAGYAGSTLRWAAAALVTFAFIGVIALLANGQSVAPSTAASSRPAKIRVGYYLSHLNATNNEPATGQPMGYALQTLHELTDPSFDLIPVIEPGTRDQGELPGILREYFRNKEPLDATSAQDLKKVDVLIAGPLYTTDAVIDAIESAVNAGTGLMTRNRFAIIAPRFTDPVKRLYGLQEAAHTDTIAAVECEVLIEHPAISSRKQKSPPAPIRMRPNGVYGVFEPNVQGIIRWINPPDRSLISGAQFYTVYCHELGKGRVLHCCYATYDAPTNIATSIGPQFTIRAIKWLARRPVD